MRRSGLTLLEITIASAVFSTVVLFTLQLERTTVTVSSEESIRQLVTVQAKRVLDTVADDFRGSAAWTYFSVPTSAPPAGGMAPTARLTKFWASKKKTRGIASDTSLFTFGPFDAGPGGSAVAFLRVVGQNVVANSSSPAYLIVDFEPKELTVAATDRPATAGGSADGGSAADHQPGRMNDDPNVAFVYYRALVVQGRILVARVRGANVNYATDNGGGTVPSSPSNVRTTPFETTIGDLGPTTLPAGVTSGFLKVSGIDTNSKTGGGKIRIQVRAVGVLRKGASASQNAITVCELETDVTPLATTPPY